MRRCNQCGTEFGLMRHVFVRGEFCNQQCSKAFKRDETSMREWQRQHRIDGQPNALSPNEKLDRKAVPPPVIQLQEGATETPLYFIGAELAEFRLAQQIGAGHAIFGIDVPIPLAWRNAAANNETSALPTLEQLAAPYVAALRTYARSSSCVLAGYSARGLIAFEIAHQLQAQGGKVEMVILLDSHATYPAPYQIAWLKLRKDWKRDPHERPTDRTSLSIGSRLRNSSHTIWWMLIQEMKRLGRYLLRTLFRDRGQVTQKLDEQGTPLHWALLERLWLNAAKSYRLRRLDCRGVLFRTDRKDEEPARALDGTLGWDNLFSKGLEIIQIPGDHITMMLRDTHNQTVALEMKKLLNQFFKKSPKKLARFA